MKNKVDREIVIIAILCLTIINVVAMFFGLNGGLRTLIVAAIAGMCGIVIPQKTFIKK